MLTIGPFAAVVALAFVSWQAALPEMGLTPVIIVFFALIGGTIHRRANQQEKALGRLAAQFADKVRTLPTISQITRLIPRRELAVRLEAYAAHTMGVLRIAFVNAAVIDFFASLFIAILPLLLGLGHLKLVMIPGFSRLQLWDNLFILMIAPEYFAPFRQFAEQYHAKPMPAAARGAGTDCLTATMPPRHARRWSTLLKYRCQARRPRRYSRPERGRKIDTASPRGRP